MSNKRQLVEILESLKNVKDHDELCHTDLGGVKIYIDNNHYKDISDVKEWYFSISYKGFMFASENIKFGEFFQDIDLTPWFDEVKEEIKPFLESKTNIDLQVITVNGKKYRKVD